MKAFFRKIVLNLLNVLARARLKRLKPFIIGVTGSVGKTSTKDAIFTLLASRYKVVRNEKSFNSEFGLPLAILEQPSGFSSLLGWVAILFKSIWKAFAGGKDLQMMVLEMGVDKPGDMNSLLQLVCPQTGVMTNIKPVHLAEGQFKDLDDIFLEKKKLAEAIPENGYAILNADDPYLLALRGKLLCKTIWYGASEIADLRLMRLESDLNGIRCTVQYKNETAEGHFELLGAYQIYVLLPAIAVGLTQGFSLSECFDALKTFSPPPGRMSKIAGINESVILDSTYNASPAAVKDALSLLHEIAPARKIAVLGSMNELGASSEEYHREIGRHARHKADVLVTVGNQAKFIAEEAQKEGFPAGSIYHYNDALEASKFLSGFVGKSDTVLVKGSQNRVRLERVVEALMANPEQAKDLLARQEKHWKQIQ